MDNAPPRGHEQKSQASYGMSTNEFLTMAAPEASKILWTIVIALLGHQNLVVRAYC